MRIVHDTALGLMTTVGIALSVPASAQVVVVDEPAVYGYRAPAPVYVAPPVAAAPVVVEQPIVVVPPGPPPNLWRQRDQVIDAVFTKEKRVLYDAGYAAQTREARSYYSPPAFVQSGPGVYYWQRPNVYGPSRSAAPPPPPPAVQYFSPPTVQYFSPPSPAGHCGTMRFWDGERCVDARRRSPYENPYNRRFLK
ncbi:hypothetical protein ACO2I3_00775 [Leptospira interrogans]